MPSSSSWVAAQLLAMAERRVRLPAQARPPFNPRPAGVIRDGSATDVVLAWLRQRRGWHTHGEIAVGTGRGTKAVCWALMYLRAHSLIESVPDGQRNARYLRYRARVGSPAPQRPEPRKPWSG